MRTDTHILDTLKLTAQTHRASLESRLRSFTLDNFDGPAAQLTALLDTHQQRCSVIAADRNLSPAGRVAKLREIGVETSAAVKALRDKHVGPLKRRIETERSALLATVAPPAADPQERMRREAQAAQIIRGFEAAGASPSETRLMYPTFPEDVRDALATAPPVVSRGKSVNGVPGTIRFERLVPEEMYQADLVARAEAKNPAATAVLNELEVLAGALTAVHQTVIAQLPQDDTPQAVA